MSGIKPSSFILNTVTPGENAKLNVPATPSFLHISKPVRDFEVSFHDKFIEEGVKERSLKLKGVLGGVLSSEIKIFFIVSV